MKEYVIGVDLGGTKIEACLLDAKKNLISRHRVLSDASKGIDKVTANIIEVIKKVSDGKHYFAIGMGTPGTYIPTDDRLYGVPHTPVYETPGFIGKIRKQSDVPVIIENDANCLAIAEFFASCYGKYSYVLAVIIGTGMGYGLILDNKLYRGAKGSAGEMIPDSDT